MRCEYCSGKEFKIIEGEKVTCLGCGAPAPDQQTFQGLTANGEVWFSDYGGAGVILAENVTSIQYASIRKEPA